MSVLLVAEIDNGALAEDATAKALSAAARIGPVTVLCASAGCDAAAKTLAAYAGVKTVLCVDDPLYAHASPEALAALVVSLAEGFSHICAPATTAMKAAMPRVAALLDVMVISDVTDVRDAETFVRPIYAGAALQTVKSSDAKKVFTVRTAAFAPAESGGAASVERAAAAGDPGLGRWVEDQKVESERPDLTAARIVVSGGRGVGSSENFAVISALADKLGAAIGASRAAVDAGYAPNDWQVGQTGKVVSPDLYVAVGISGAIQHLAGMKDSKVIVAINKDEEAPIFKIADYGLVADLFTAVPTLTEQL